jgi:hypothetical protein
MLFHQKRCQLLRQRTGHILALREGDELFLVGLREHPLKRGPGPLQPSLSKRLSILPAQKRPTFHGSPSNIPLEP